MMYVLLHRLAAVATDLRKSNVVNVEGGPLACEQAGLPVSRGKKAMALERQVRIAAGSLIPLGFALSYVTPYFLGLSAFVGLG